MKKTEKQITRKQRLEEAKTIRALRNNAKGAAAKIIEELQDLDLTPDNIYHKRTQAKIKRIIDRNIKQLKKDGKQIYDNGFRAQYMIGYVGALYVINKSEKIPLITTPGKRAMNKTTTRSAINTKISKFIERNYNAQFARRTQSAITRVVTEGKNAAEAAREIAVLFDKETRWKALRIARTEITRIYNMAKLDMWQDASNDGVDTYKEWVATTDGDTREEHAELDGQIIPFDEDFEVDGETASCPGDFGVAELDCNCRCTIVEKRAETIDKSTLDRLQERAEWYKDNRGFDLDKIGQFSDFYEKYIDNVL